MKNPLLVKLARTRLLTYLTALIVGSFLIIFSATLTVSAQTGCGPQNQGLPGCPTSSQSSSTSLGNGCPNQVGTSCLKNNALVQDIQKIVDFLSAGVGIIVVGVIILGGIQYSMAGDNATAVAAARKRIINALIALVAFMLTFAFLEWLIPGGVFG